MSGPTIEQPSRTLTLYLPPLRDYQVPVLTSEAQDDLTVSTPQAGKTVTGGAWITKSAWEGGKSPNPWWWMAPTYKQVRDGMRKIADLCYSAQILAREPKLSTDFEIELISGGFIEGRSWERPGGMRGPTIRGGVVDEFGQLTREAYSSISSRRAETVIRGEGMLRYLGNVGKIGGVAEDLWNQAVAKQLGFACRTWTWRDRAAALGCSCPKEIPPGFGLQHIDKTCPRGRYQRFIDAERSRMSGPQFRQTYEAEWADWNELPAYGFDRAEHVTEEVDRVDGLPIDLSCDFNVDPMAWICGQHYKTEAWAFDEIVLEGHATTVQACAEFKKRFPDKHQAVVVYGDASGAYRSTKSKLSDYGIIKAELGDYYHDFRVEVPAANPPVKHRLNAYNRMLRAADGTVSYRTHPRCSYLNRDLARVSKKPGTDDLDKRDKRLTHASDADGYRMVKLFPAVARVARVATPSRSRGRSDLGLATARF
ncbi:MAG: hypothetical protein GY722_21000 [bacterium]|nr:hypothetical protein [bacterium]